jgi:hypothetical protein
MASAMPPVSLHKRLKAVPKPSQNKSRLDALLKLWILLLPLGGAAVYRCDQCLILSAGFSR